MSKTRKISKNRLPPSILYAKQDNDSLLVVDMENENVFYRIDGAVACDAFKLLSGNKPDSVIIKTLLKKYPEAPEKDLTKDFKFFIKSLVKAKVLQAHEA